MTQSPSMVAWSPFGWLPGVFHKMRGSTLVVLVLPVDRVAHFGTSHALHSPPHPPFGHPLSSPTLEERRSGGDPQASGHAAGGSNSSAMRAKNGTVRGSHHCW